VPAALLTVVISRSLRFIPHRDGLDVSASLARLNDEMIACQRDTHRFATAIAGTVNTRTREVTLASAGHPPALRIDGSARTTIDSGGPLLGVFPDQEFPSVTFQLEEDETLLLYSDGFETAFSSEGMDIRKAKQAYLDQLCSVAWPIGDEERDLKTAFKALEELLDRQSGSLHQLDDLTALAIAPTHASVVARQAA
jgi:serine phosphatase RsbU (regulator of sigma subunit)